MKVLLSILKKILAVVTVLAIVCGVIVGYNVTWLNKTFITTFYSVETDKDISDLRIVELSDLHLHEYGTKNAELVERIRNLNPNIIAVAGDMNIDENSNYSVVIDLLEQLVEIAPVYYAPGNHEWASTYSYNYSQLPSDIEATGAHYMVHDYEYVEVNGNKLMIGGFFEWPRSEFERDADKQVAVDMDAVTREQSDVYTVLLCHCPEVFYMSMKDLSVDLGLSGHAHGGQVRLPMTDGLWSTDQGFLPKYTSGVREIGSSTVVISRGLGDSEPVPRIFNQPELVVIDVN